jgi:hypothetical protein
MSRFVVDHRSLLALRATLGRLHEQLLAIPTVVGGYEGTLGSRALEAELGQFCSRWHYGILQVADRTDGMMRRLDGAAAAYQRIEQRVAASGQGSGTTSIGGGPPSGSGSGTTSIGGGPPSGSHSGSGSGTTVVG